MPNTEKILRHHQAVNQQALNFAIISVQVTEIATQKGAIIVNRTPETLLITMRAPDSMLLNRPTLTDKKS